MEKIKTLVLWPFGGILDRHLIRGFLKIVGISLLCTAALYLIVDFFDRVDSLLKAGASVWTSIRYFLYKLPLLVSRVFGFAVLFSALFSVGMLSRTHELTAMRASGLSVHRISLPLFVASVLIGALNFFWNETVVPVFTREAQYIYKTEVKKKRGPAKSLLRTRDIWFRSEEAFISVDRVDPRRNVLEGLSIFLLNRDFTLRGLIEVPSAHWNGTRWEAKRPMEWQFLPNGQMVPREGDIALPLSETPEDLNLLARDPEEFSFFDLKKQIADLKGKGIDVKEQEVDMQVKLAVPFVSPLMVLLAIPFAVRQGRSGGLALSFGLTMLIGFGYWFMLSFCISLGHSGALPGWMAAWLPNLTMTMVGLFFYSTAEESS